MGTSIRASGTFVALHIPESICESCLTSAWLWFHISMPPTWQMGCRSCQTQVCKVPCLQAKQTQGWEDHLNISEVVGAPCSLPDVFFTSTDPILLQKWNCIFAVVSVCWFPGPSQFLSSATAWACDSFLKGATGKMDSKNAFKEITWQWCITNLLESLLKFLNTYSNLSEFWEHLGNHRKKFKSWPPHDPSSIHFYAKFSCLSSGTALGLT